MSSFQEQKDRLLTEAAKLHARNEMSKEIGPDFFEPGMMEYPGESDASFEESTGKLMLRFESKGTRYDGRTEQIEKVKVGDVIRIVRDKENAYNHNNFLLLTRKGKDVGNMPAEICNAVAPLYDGDCLVIESAKVSFVEPISVRSRHAKQAILFVEMYAKLTAPETDPAVMEPVEEIDPAAMEPVEEADPVAMEPVEEADPAAMEPVEEEDPATMEPVEDAEKKKDVSIESTAETTDPYALRINLRENRFFIGGYEIRRDMLYEEIKKQIFCENAKEVPDLWDPDCLHVFLKHTVKYAGEEWVLCLVFKAGKFRDLWLEHAKIFQQKSLIKNAVSNPRLRKKRSMVYSKLKSRLDELTGSKGEQVMDKGNLQYIFHFDGHGTMLVQDNKLPAVVIYIQYYRQEEPK